VHGGEPAASRRRAGLRASYYHCDGIGRGPPPGCAAAFLPSDPLRPGGGSREIANGDRSGKGQPFIIDICSTRWPSDTNCPNPSPRGLPPQQRTPSRRCLNDSPPTGQATSLSSARTSSEREARPLRQGFRWSGAFSRAGRRPASSGHSRDGDRPGLRLRRGFSARPSRRRR
jgi:hypothetical protein